MKITEYPATTTLQPADVLLTDGVNGTKKISISDARIAIADQKVSSHANTFAHRNTFRGKNLGATLTSAQKTAISNGTFDDIWLGDYWTISNAIYRVIDFNYWYGLGDVPLYQNHIVLMPDTSLYTAQMNNSLSTATGYIGSTMRSTGLNAAKTTINNAFGASVLSRREMFDISYVNGIPNSFGWYTATVEIPDIASLFGYGVYTYLKADGSQSPYISSTSQQFALFRLYPYFIYDRSTAVWTRSVCGAGAYDGLINTGYRWPLEPTATAGVRPYFAIG